MNNTESRKERLIERERKANERIAKQQQPLLEHIIRENEKKKMMVEYLYGEENESDYNLDFSEYGIFEPCKIEFYRNNSGTFSIRLDTDGIYDYQSKEDNDFNRLNRELIWFSQINADMLKERAQLQSSDDSEQIIDKLIPCIEKYFKIYLEEKTKMSISESVREIKKLEEKWQKDRK